MLKNTLTKHNTVLHLINMQTIVFIWFVLTALSLAYVTWNLITQTPVSWVQKLAWILVTAYAGPIGLIAYWFTCRTREGKTHDESTNKTWQQAMNSEMHCLAGDATGIIASAALVYGLGLPNGIDLIIEYTSAFIVGLLIFQALMMKPMYHDSYLTAVRKTFFPEAVSMNMVMVGMIPVMIVLMHHLPDGDNPLSPNFWFIMAMATIAGGITAYPINYWLISENLKHGCMTMPSPHAGMQHTHAHREISEIPLMQQWAWIIGTFILLMIVVFVVSRYYPIKFSY
jgi:hypothetical protein